MRSIVLSCVICAVFATLSLSCGGSSGGSDDGGRVFYVDSVSGNDANDGRDESTAWKTLDKVNATDLRAGDTVLFKKGCTFPGGLELTESGSAGDPITFEAYGTGTDPVFLGSRMETGWTNTTGAIYQKTISYTPGKTGAGIVLEDGTPLAFKAWNTDASTSLGADNGVFTYDPKDLNTSVIYIRCTDTADPSTHTIDAGYHLIGAYSTGVSYIDINNIIFRNYSCHGVSLRNSHNINVMGCTAENIGGAVLSLSPLLYGGNGFEFTLDSSDCAVSEAVAGNIFDSGFSPQVFASGTTTKNVSFMNCVANKCGFAGIEISVLGYNGSSGEKLEKITVTGCRVLDSGRGWSGVRYGNEGHGIRVKADAGAGSITGVSITRTEVTNCAGSGIYIGGAAGTVDISRSMIFKNTKTGILCQNASATDATLRLRLTSSTVIDNSGVNVSGIGYDVVAGNGFEIVNNTLNGNTVSSGTDIVMSVPHCGGSAILKNNVFVETSSLKTYLYVGSTPGSFQSDYNCFYEKGGNIIGWIADAYTTVADFASGHGTDQNSIGTDPLLESTTDFHLQSGSPCKNNGVAAGVTIDYEGNAYGATPSRGAFR